MIYKLKTIFKFYKKNKVNMSFFVLVSRILFVLKLVETEQQITWKIKKYKYKFITTTKYVIKGIVIILNTIL